MYILIKKILKKIIEKVIKNSYQRPLALLFDTHIDFSAPIIKNSYLKFSQLDISGINQKTVDYLVNMFISHRFDLLGSGWVKNSYDSVALGVEGYKYNCNSNISDFDHDGNWLKHVLLRAHIKKSREIWKLVSDDYIPVDWQKDFKSGYRWSAKRFYKDQKVAPKLGVDIKVPWELARLQHLPQLAIFTQVLPNLKYKIIKEFRNQVLDFIATNPPRMGVNWMCAMDVAIRAANLLLAYDMFVQIDGVDKVLDNDFKQLFSMSIYEHALHIVNNLEWSNYLTTNHYLSNVVGLLFCSAYLDGNTNIDQWLAFSIQEIISEFRKQFCNDGGNFEASTSYHRVSSELMGYSAALILGLDDVKKVSLQNYSSNKWKSAPKLKPLALQEWDLVNEIFFPNWFIERLYRAGNFTKDLTKPTGEIPQIGDNDSCRFFRLSPNGDFLTNQDAENKYLNLAGYIKLTDFNENDFFWDENILNHGTLLSSFYGLYNDADLYQFAQKFPLESSLIRNLSKFHFLQIPRVKKECVYFNNHHNDINSLVYKKEAIFPLADDVNQTMLADLQLKSYPDFGIYIFKSNCLHLTISICPIGQNGNGGHTHNDKLSFELNISGKDIIRDPGTYLYTALPQKRNLFRSVAAHNCPYHKIEQNGWMPGVYGLFNIFNQSKCKMLECYKDSIVLRIIYKDIVDVVKFSIETNRLVINVYSNKTFTYLDNQMSFFSSGYGKLEFVSAIK